MHNKTKYVSRHPLSSLATWGFSKLGFINRKELAARISGVDALPQQAGIVRDILIENKIIAPGTPKETGSLLNIDQSNVSKFVTAEKLRAVEMKLQMHLFDHSFLDDQQSREDNKGAQIIYRRFNALINKYNYLSDTYPTRTNIATGMIAYGSGELLAQLLTGPNINASPLLSMFAIGGFYGVEMPFVYNLINKIPNKTIIGKTVRNIVYNVGYGYMFTFRHIAGTQLLAGVAANELFTNALFIKTTAAWAGWLPLLVPWGHILHNYIPLKYRFISSAILSFSWGAVTSFLAHS